MRIGIAGGLLAGASLACGGGSAPGTPSSPAPADDATASFTLRGAGYGERRVTYSSGAGGLVFCRRQAGPSYLWIRLAAERAADGANGPHLDIDLCNFTGSATYRVVHDVSAGLRCAQGATWDLWWHDGPARVYVSRPTSPGCEATLTSSGSTLQGTFQCQGLTPTNAPGESLEIAAGSFRCTVTGP